MRAARSAAPLLAPPLDAGGNRRRHLLVLKRLADAAERAAFPGGNRRVERGISRDHRDDGLGVDFQNLFERTQPPHARHRHIQEHNIVSAPPVSLQTLFARLRQVNPIPFRRKQRLQYIAHDLLVVDDEYRTLFCHRTIKAVTGDG
jgi:hypothetical protein